MCIIHLGGFFFFFFQHLRLSFVVFTNKEISPNAVNRLTIIPSPTVRFRRVQSPHVKVSEMTYFVSSGA